MREAAAGAPVAFVVALLAIATTALADDLDARAVSIISLDERHPGAPSLIVAAPIDPVGLPLLSTAFTAIDDNGAVPIRVEHLEIAALDVGIVVDTADDVPVSTLEREQGAAVELLRHLEGADEVGISTSVGGSAYQRPTHDRLANFSFVSALDRGGARYLVAGIRSAAAELDDTTGDRRAIVVFGAGSEDWTLPAATTALAEELATRDVQLFWLVVDGAPPPIVEDLIAAGQQVTVIEAMSAVAAVDRVADVLGAQYRVTIDLAGATGPVLLRVDTGAAVQEIAAGVEGSPDPSVDSRDQNLTPSPARPPLAPEAPEAATPVPAVPRQSTDGERSRSIPLPLSGTVEDITSLSATESAMIFFASIAAATTLTVVFASGSPVIGRRPRRVERR